MAKSPTLVRPEAWGKTTILLKEFNNEITSNEDLFYSKIHIFNSQHQIKFLKKIGTNIEAHSLMTYLELDAFEHSDIKKITPFKPSFQGSWNFVEEGIERV